jgi:hypothetical protein
VMQAATKLCLHCIKKWLIHKAWLLWIWKIRITGRERRKGVNDSGMLLYHLPRYLYHNF